MSVTIARNTNGKYGVVEPNHISAPRSGKVYAQLPAADGIDVLENGMYVDYAYADGVVKFAANAKYMVFNEEKLWDERKQSHADYAMKKEDYTEGSMVPRVFLMETGDIYTTNTLADGSYENGDKLDVAATGLLTKSESGTFAQVVAETTLPDGITPAVKIQVL